MNAVILLLLTFSGSLLSEGHLRDHFVVWNVGQGQWATAVLLDECIHFDMGGEFFPWKKIHAACAKKQNRIFLSHADWDHVGALNKKASLKKWASMCLEVAPPTGSKSRRKLWAHIEECDSRLEEIKIWSPTVDKKKDSNSLSHIAIFRGILIPGDSTKAEEKIWKDKFNLSKVKTFLLGHHGSRTSNGEDLIGKMYTTKQAIASSRWQRYKHPHPEITARLKRHHIALLTTEDWGNIWINPN